MDNVSFMDFKMGQQFKLLLQEFQCRQFWNFNLAQVPRQSLLLYEFTRYLILFLETWCPCEGLFEMLFYLRIRSFLAYVKKKR